MSARSVAAVRGLVYPSQLGSLQGCVLKSAELMIVDDSYVDLAASYQIRHPRRSL